MVVDFNMGDIFIDSMDFLPSWASISQAVNFRPFISESTKMSIEINILQPHLLDALPESPDTGLRIPS